MATRRPPPSLASVPVTSLPLERFSSILPDERFADVVDAILRARRLLEGRVVWNINSTARGGGVAELLRSLLAYANGAGVDARWLVVPGTPEFFAITKRIHNNLHDSPGDGGLLNEQERADYEAALAPSLEELEQLVAPGDVVIVHDPQPAGLIPRLEELGRNPVIWRCHVGTDDPSDLSRRAWRFLHPYVEPADAYVFSRRAFVWEALDPARVSIIAPVIDAFSPKNQDLHPESVRAILVATGLLQDGARGDAAFQRFDGEVGHVSAATELLDGAPPPQWDRPIVLQVSRWDRLKDPLGVIQGFADHVAPETEADLVYAGPSVEAVADDPEGKEVLDEVIDRHRRLPGGVRSRIHLACLPMQDLDENAAIVNALQRRAAVVVQKSIAEGFGLTVAEAMWKARPVVATRVGGIQDQVTDGVNGVLLDDPLDLDAYGSAVRGLLLDPDRAERLGHAARQEVRDEFLAVRSLIQYLDLIERLI